MNETVITLYMLTFILTSFTAVTQA